MQTCKNARLSQLMQQTKFLNNCGNCNPLPLNLNCWFYMIQVFWKTKNITGKKMGKKRITLTFVFNKYYTNLLKFWTKIITEPEKRLKPKNSLDPIKIWSKKYIMTYNIFEPHNLVWHKTYFRLILFSKSFKQILKCINKNNKLSSQNNEGLISLLFRKRKIYWKQVIF